MITTNDSRYRTKDCWWGGWVVGAFVALSLGCTSTNTPGEITFDHEETFDGLRLLSNSRAQRAWMKPGTDLSRYTSIWPQSAGIQFRPVERPRGARARSGQSEFPVSDQAKQRVSALMNETFTEELGRLQRFKVVDGPGPDVMIVRGALLDVVSFVPPEPVGRGDIFISRVGVLTFVVELRDSESNAVIARAVDRRAADRPANTMQASNTVTNRADVRRLARRWATWLRESLETLPDRIPDGN